MPQPYVNSILLASSKQNEWDTHASSIPATDYIEGCESDSF